MKHFFQFLGSKTFLINLLIAIILISGGLYATLHYLDEYTLHDEVLLVPTLKGEHENDLEILAAKNKEFELIINDSIFINGTKGGVIVEQNPKPDKEVKRGRKIYLTVAARQQPTLVMPRLVDRSLRQATSMMETYGLQLGELIYKPDECLNCVLEQTINGKKIIEGDRIRRGSTIDLVVGQGLSTELVPVPYIIDFSAEMARDLLNAQSLNLGVAIYDESVESREDSLNAHVYKQVPFFSKLPVVRMGSSVDIYLTLDTNKVIHSVNPSDTL